MTAIIREHLFGFCEPTAHSCNQCPREYRGQNGVVYRCTCPAHRRRARPAATARKTVTEVAAEPASTATGKSADCRVCGNPVPQKTGRGRPKLIHDECR